MNKKVALALAGLVLIITASFAPVSVAQWPPCVQSDIYVIMGGQKVVTVGVTLAGIPIMVLRTPFATRDPWLKPYQGMQELCFSDPVQVVAGYWVVFVNKTWGTPLIHEFWVSDPSVQNLLALFQLSPWMRVTELPLPGFGWIYLNDSCCDVDVITFNNNTGTYWGTSPYGDSPLAGEFATPVCSFPDPGYDHLPGFCPAGPGKGDDGFGDGDWDPKGSSILYEPEIFIIEGFNITTQEWAEFAGAPLCKIWTTETAYCHERQPESPLYCLDSVKFGEPWEFLASCVPWKDESCNKMVTYVSAGSVGDYELDPGPPRIAIDLLYDQEVKKVRADQIGRVPGSVVADIDCNKTVNIGDIAICTLAFGAWDEGLGPDGLPLTADDLLAADPRYDARADMNCDGLIDIFDLVRIALDFGCTITPECVVCIPP